jgi:glycerol uptake facilitator-like aquaporin
VPVVAPVVGAILGAFLYDVFVNKHHVAPEAGR